MRAVPSRCVSAVVGALAAAAACSDLSIPADAVIPCANDGECPDGFVCQRELCVDEAKEDRAPPSFSEAPVLAPTIGNNLTEFVLTFRASEPLRTPPRVLALSERAGAQAFVLDEDASSGRDFRFTYVNVANVEEDRALPISIELEDRAGLRAVLTAPDALQIDNRLPTFAGAVYATRADVDPPVQGTSFGPGIPVDVTFETSEVLAILPVVDVFRAEDYDPAHDVIPAQTLLLEHRAGAARESTKFTYRLAVPATADEDFFTGAYLVRMVMLDPAGNENTGNIGITLTLDFDAPAVLLTPAALAPDLALVPDVANSLGQVSALRDGGTAIVTFRADEDVLDPTVRAVCPGRDLAFARLADEENATFFTFLLSDADVADLGEVSCPIEAELADAVGNRETRALGLTLAIDTIAPNAPDTNSIGRVRYTRAPWGSRFTGGLPAFSVRGTVDDTGLTVFALDDAGNEIGTAVYDSEGGFTIDLDPVDRRSVRIAIIDGAGNVSPPSLVRDATWIATLGLKVPGSTFENPQRAEVTADLRAHQLVQEPETLRELDAAEYAAAAPFGAGGVTSASVARWRESAPPASFPPTTAPIAYDSARDTAVMFVGSDGADVVSQTWEWHDRRWTQRAVLGAPITKRVNHAIAYDAARGRVVVFGGISNGGPVKDTWEWDGAAGTWTRHTSLPQPPERRGAAMAWDSDRGVTVLFGDDDRVLDDTWEWDGAAWIEHDVSPRPPPSHGIMAYDPIARRSVFVGENGETWEWNGADRTWSDRGVAPSEMSALVFDGARVIGYRLGTFAWSSIDGAWTSIALSTSPPDSPAVYLDPIANELVGFENAGANPVVQTLDPARATWSQHPLDTQGPPAAPASSAPDLARGNVVRFVSALAGTWQWQPFAESYDVRLTGALPAPTSGFSAAVFDVGVGGVVGFDNITFGAWTWDGLQWSTLPDGPPVVFAAAAADEARGEVVLFGGLDGNTVVDTTWIWRHDTGLEELAVAGPPARVSARMAYDRARAVVVLFGGSPAESGDDRFGDVWEWDGETRTWRDATPAGGPAPAPRRAAAGNGRGLDLAWDDTRTRVVLSDAAGFSDLGNSVWEWDGAAWLEVNALDGDGPGDSAGELVEHPQSGQPVFLADNAPHGAWTWDAGADARPAIIWSIPWASAGIDASAIVDTAIAVDGDATGGANVFAWTPVAGAWVALLADGEGLADVDAIAGDDARALLFGARQEMHFAVAARAGFGAGTAPSFARLDAAELNVRYRLP